MATPSFKKWVGCHSFSIKRGEEGAHSLSIEKKVEEMAIPSPLYNFLSIKKNLSIKISAEGDHSLPLREVGEVTIPSLLR